MPDRFVTVDDNFELPPLVLDALAGSLPAGPAGPAGSPGAPGVQGTPGAQGVAGPAGPQGPAGATGAASTVPGPTGATGPQGPSGLNGDTGAQGPIGLTGPAGAAGAQGAQGTPGNIGLTGATGPAGAAGATGPAGAAGVDGARFVNHGSNAATARPSGTSPVIWIGSVQPTNLGSGDFYFISSTEPVADTFTGMLDGFAVAPWRAYSVSRRLRVGYTGPLMRVRRSSDDTESDIGYNTDGTLNSTALLAFTGSGSGFVKTMYDQSGNTRHMTQSTATAQPRIVNAGALDTLNSKPALQFDGTSDYFSDNVPGLYSAGAASMALVMSSAAPGGTVRVVGESNSTGTTANTAGSYTPLRNSTGNWNVQITNDANTSILAASSGALFNGTGHVATFTDTGALVNTYIDGTVGHNSSVTRSGALTVDRFNVGAMVRSTVDSFYGGKVSELILWTSALNSTNRGTIQTAQKSHFGTP